MAAGFQAYFDESGIHQRARLCIVAGYVGSVRQWKQFEALWAPYANSPEFHAKRFFSRDQVGRRVPPYADWDDAKAAAYLEQLLNAIRTVNVSPVGAIVNVQAFLGYSEEERRYLTGGYQPRLGKWTHTGAPTKPYYAAFIKAVMSAIEQVKRRDWRVDFVFDQQDTIAPLALQLYARIKKDWAVYDPKMANKMGNIMFRARKGAIALQATDLLAYCWYQEVLRGRAASADVHRVLKMQRKNTLVLFTKESMDKLLGLRPATPGKTYTIP